MTNKPFHRLKLACYTVNVSMAIVSNLPPLLFLTFRSMYGISFAWLGFLVLLNFTAQLGIDLLFSFFSHKFHIQRVVKLTPVLTVVGLVLYALSPLLFPKAVYFGLLLGTLFFSAACGFAEVLISPVIAAIPSEQPEHEMSKLHSIYAWGVVGVVAVSTLFLLAFGSANWQWLVLILALVPLYSLYLFTGTQIPLMETPKKVSGVIELLKNRAIWLCVAAIFLGGAAELTMAQWASSYLEKAVGIPKIWGDLFGVAMFALAMGLGRSLYAKRGRNIGRTLFISAIGATACYFIAIASPLPLIGLLACALTGFCVSMLWPGTLIVASNRFPAGGVFIYALMAAGGDLGASIAPQLVGVIADSVLANPEMAKLADVLDSTPEQLGMKLGMLVGLAVSAIAIPIYYTLWKQKKAE